jgi:hypothetical protein
VPTGPGRGHGTGRTAHARPLDINYSAVIPAATNGCGFDITIQQTGTGEATYYYDQSGTLVRELIRTLHTTATYSANGKSYTVTPSPASGMFDFAAGTITARGLEGHLIIPGQGLLGVTAGKVVFDLTTGQVITYDGQNTLSDYAPESPQVCADLAP